MHDRRGWRSVTLAALGLASIAVLLPLATFLVATWLQGWQLQTVLSGSMQPTYPVGSLLVVGQLDAAAVEPGMAIVFEDPAQAGRLVTHRVVAIAPGDTLQFWTRGDANATRDAVPVPARMVRGHVLWAVPHFGTVMEWLQWPRSFIVLVVVPAALLLLTELRRRRREPSQSSTANASA